MALFVFGEQGLTFPVGEPGRGEPVGTIWKGLEKGAEVKVLTKLELVPRKPMAVDVSVFLHLSTLLVLLARRCVGHRSFALRK